MTGHNDVAGWRYRPDPRGRNAIDLPYTAAQAAALARVLDDIRTRTAHTSDRDPSLRGRNAGGAFRVPGAPPVNTPTRYRQNDRYQNISGMSPTASA